MSAFMLWRWAARLHACSHIITHAVAAAHRTLCHPGRGLAVTFADNGLAYGVGDNSHGQLGVSPSDRSQQTTFQAVHEISGVVWVSTDTKHSAACTRASVSRSTMTRGQPGRTTHTQLSLATRRRRDDLRLGCVALGSQRG